MPTASRAPALEPLLLHYKEAAEILGHISDQMIAKLVARGLLEGRRLGRRRYVTLVSVRNLAATGTSELVAVRDQKYASSGKPPGILAANAARRGRGRPRKAQPVT